MPAHIFTTHACHSVDRLFLHLLSRLPPRALSTPQVAINTLHWVTRESCNGQGRKSGSSANNLHFVVTHVMGAFKYKSAPNACRNTSDDDGRQQNEAHKKAGIDTKHQIRRYYLYSLLSEPERLRDLREARKSHFPYMSSKHSTHNATHLNAKRQTEAGILLLER